MEMEYFNVLLLPTETILVPVLSQNMDLRDWYSCLCQDFQQVFVIAKHQVGQVEIVPHLHLLVSYTIPALSAACTAVF